MFLMNDNIAVIMIEEKKKENITESGLILPTSKDDVPDLAVGVVFKVGPDVDLLTEGDKILFRLVDSMTGCANGVDYVFMKKEAVVAKL